METSEYADDRTKVCSICGETRMMWQMEKDSRRPDGHGPRCKRCIKERRIERTKYPKTQEPAIINSEGGLVSVKHTNKIIQLLRSRGGRHRAKFVAFAYMQCRINKKTGALLWFNEAIKFHRQSKFTAPEDIAQQISAESIHLALYRSGFGVENQKLDKARLHTWLSTTGRVEEYEGLAIKQFGLRKDD